MTDYKKEMQKHIAFMGKVQHKIEDLGWIMHETGLVVEQFKEAMRFFIDHIKEKK